MFETVQHYTWCLARPPNTIALFYDTVPDLMRRYSYHPTCNCIVFSSCLWHLIYIVQNLSHNLNFWWPEGPWEAGTIRKATTKAVGSHHVSTGVVCDLCRQSKSRKYTSHYPINPLTCCCLAIISFPQRWEGRGRQKQHHADRLCFDAHEWSEGRTTSSTANALSNWAPVAMNWLGNIFGGSHI